MGPVDRGVGMDMTPLTLHCLTRAEVAVFLDLLRHPPARLVSPKPHPIAPFRRAQRILSADTPVISADPGDGCPWAVTVNVELDPVRYRIWDKE